MMRFLPPAILFYLVQFLLLISVDGYSQSLPLCRFADTTFRKLSYKTYRTVDREAVMYIPVVFHIVYNGTTQNITNEDIYSQLKVINEDFSKTNGDALSTIAEFRSVAADVAIQFYLAEDENGIGITRTATQHGPFYNDDLH